MDGAFSFNCGDPLFIISKAPPGAKSDKKLMKILVYWKYSASSAAGQRRELASRLKTIILGAWQRKLPVQSEGRVPRAPNQKNPQKNQKLV